MSDILTDYREWRASLEDRIGTHSAGCHMWPRHERCMIHRLAAALEQARSTDACGLHARESQRLQPDRTPEAASTPGEGTRQDGCIVTRLRSEVAWEADVGELMAEAAGEIERLRLAIRRLAEQDATLSVCDGNVTVTMDATLTDEEREAIEVCIEDIRFEDVQAALRGLLERTTHPERD